MFGGLKHGMKRLGVLMALTLFLAGCSPAQPAPSVPEKPVDKIPAIPHTVKEGMDCKSCHATGANGAKVTKHSDRPNCLQCHKPAAK